MDVSSKLQLKPGQSVAVLNPPPGLELPEAAAAATAADADAVIAFVVRQDELGSAEQAVAAAREDRLAWIGLPQGWPARDRSQPRPARRGAGPPRRAARPPGVNRRHLVRVALPPGEAVRHARPFLAPLRASRQVRDGPGAAVRAATISAPAAVRAERGQLAANEYGPGMCREPSELVRQSAFGLMPSMLTVAFRARSRRAAGSHRCPPGGFRA
jgi:hypothetical protein